ncbi:hypothetical protein D3C85_878840 [compost metagenome]
MLPNTGRDRCAFVSCHFDPVRPCTLAQAKCIADGPVGITLFTQAHGSSALFAVCCGIEFTGICIHRGATIMNCKINTSSISC